MGVNLALLRSTILYFYHTFTLTLSIFNKGAKFDYEIIREHLSLAGIVFYGTEIKSIRLGKSSEHY
jgi:hypothetical protein